MGSTSRFTMLVRTLSLSCLCLALVSAQKWPALKTTFSVNPFGGFNDQPRTASEAEAAGWELIASCDGKFLGHRYANPADFSIVLVFDDAGYIAGTQSVIPLQYVDSTIVDYSGNPAYQLDMWYDQEAYFTTAYFVDPTLICGGGRSSDEWESQGTGDRLMVQVGETPDSLLNIPITREAADMETGVWYDHYCFIGMGDHYLQFNYQPDQDCFSVLPLQILFSEGVINGFVWQHTAMLPGDQWEHPDGTAISMIIDRPPPCVMELAVNPGLSTMHHYFYDYPWLTLCPLKHQRNLGGYKKLMRTTK